MASAHIVTLAARSRARPSDPAIAYCQGHHYGTIEAHPRRGSLKPPTWLQAIAQRFGREAVDGKIQAHIVSIER